MLKIDGALEIVNNDGDMMQHVYIDYLEFSFDSGDKVPRSRSYIILAKA